MSDVGSGRSWCVIVPCYNEEHRLEGGTFVEFATADPDAHFLFVNDGSRDGTRELLASLAARLPDRIRVLDLTANGGKAEAVRLAARSIEAWKAFAYAGFLDADLSAPLSTIGDLRGALERNPLFEFAMGSRVALLGRNITRHASRHYLGRVFATAVSVMLGLPVYDTQCGAKLFRTGLVPDLFGEPFVTRWFFDVELIFRLLRSRGRAAGSRIIVEVPLREWVEKGGSKLKPGDFVRTPIDLLKIWRHYS